MLCKQITYTDYNGTSRTENFYFNLSKAELLEMELGVNGKMSSLLEQIVQEKDVAKITAHFKSIILKSYGQKSLDGKRFDKSQEVLDAFTQSEAYSQLFVELATNDEKAIEFINALIPADLVETKN
jgi:PDZ domain-containing secreted protein